MDVVRPPVEEPEKPAPPAEPAEPRPHDGDRVVPLPPELLAQGVRYKKERAVSQALPRLVLALIAGEKPDPADVEALQASLE